MLSGRAAIASMAAMTPTSVHILMCPRTGSAMCASLARGQSRRSVIGSTMASTPPARTSSAIFIRAARAGRRRQRRACC